LSKNGSHFFSFLTKQLWGSYNKDDYEYVLHMLVVELHIVQWFQDRHAEFGNIVRSRRLLQQFVVDCYTMLETQRISYIKNNQQTIHCGYLNGLHEAMTSGDTNA